MRGKKIDVDFVSTFITDCVIKDISLSEDICKEAKLQIADIDAEIRRVEDLKIRRSKLNDVVITFDKLKISNSKEKEHLSFFEVKDKNLANLICKFIPSECTLLLSHIRYNRGSCLLVIEELLRLNILSRNNNILNKGLLFDDYKNFLRNYS